MSEFYDKKEKFVSKSNKINSSKQYTAIVCKTEENVEPGSRSKENNLEDLLCDLKLSGRYHIQFLFLISFLIIMNAGHAIHYTFSAENIKHWCKYSNCKSTEIMKLGQNLTFDFKCNKYELYENNGTCTVDNFKVSSFKDCSEWLYDDPKSFVAEFNLGCRDWKRTLVGTMHSAGFMIGLLLIGPMSDRFGRKKIIIFSILYSGVIGVIKSMVTSYWIFIALETLEAVLGDNYSTAYIMVVEMMTTKNRPMTIIVFTLSNALGRIFLAIIAFLTPSWRIFLLSLYAPAFIFILYIFCLDESPRWLLINGRKAEAGHIIKKAANINNTVIDESKFANLKCNERTGINLWTVLTVTFSSRKLLIRLLLCFCIWFAALFNNYSLLITSVAIEGNKYINFGLVALSGLPGAIILFYILRKYNRKGPLILASTLTGIFCVSQSFIPKGYNWLSIFLFACGGMTESITLKMIYLYTTELFPTYTRNTMLALCSAFGRIGTILTPLTPLLITYWSSLPTFLVGILSLVTALIVNFMPDTSEDMLPDNIQQAEFLGSKENKKHLSNIKNPSVS